MKIFKFLLIITVVIFYSCTDDLVEEYYDINGLVQKGPFVSGTSITVSELNIDFSASGRTFNTLIRDNTGSFDIETALKSNYVSLRADGFYFNEVSGKTSASQISLYALADVSDKYSVNVNVLSHLEKPRIEYLISKGMGFKEAKMQAQSEVLSIFKISKSNIRSSEQLDISQEGDDNAILLAASLILQGYRSEAELTELLSNISSDMKEDGKLSNQVLVSTLTSHAKYLDTISIRNNLTSRYSELTEGTVIPCFEKYLRRFNASTPPIITESLFKYPVSGIYGVNILDLNRTIYNDSIHYSFVAEIPVGARLNIKITALGDYGIWGNWGMLHNSEINWTRTVFDLATKSQVFTIIEGGKTSDYKIVFLSEGRFLIEYFEGGGAIPTRSKIIETI